MTITLAGIWRLEDLNLFKVHYARFNQRDYPLEVLARDKAEWQQWQEYWPSRNDFNRPYIFSLAQVHNEPECWLFGGIYRVLGLEPEGTRWRYKVEPSDVGASFVGRLKIQTPYKDRPTRLNLENHFPTFTVTEILREAYAGRPFIGFDTIDISFQELETIVRNARQDWSAALANIKGIYLISDLNTGKRYVGSAYGEQGIWARWCDYVTSGHGGNVQLQGLITEPTLQYSREWFRFGLLEIRPFSTPDKVIFERESFWKNMLLTRGQYGLNKN